MFSKDSQAQISQEQEKYTKLNKANVDYGSINNNTNNDNINLNNKARISCGILLLLIAATLAVVHSFIAKYLLIYRGLHFVQILFTRVFGSVCLYFLWFQYFRCYKKEYFEYYGNSNDRLFLFLRSLFFGVAAMLWVISLLWIKISDAITLCQLNAFWILIGAHFFLKEKMNVFSGICVIVGVGGVVLIAQPTFIFHVNDEYYKNRETEKYIGMAMVVMCSVFGAIPILMTRINPNNNHWLSMELFGSTCGLLIFIPFLAICYFLYHYFQSNYTVYQIITLYIWNFDTAIQDYALNLSLSLIVCISATSLTRGLQLSYAKWASMLKYSQVPIAYIGEILIFNISVNVLTWIGASLVLSAVVAALLSHYFGKGNDNNDNQSKKNQDNQDNHVNIADLNIKNDTNSELVTLMDDSEDNNDSVQI